MSMLTYIASDAVLKEAAVREEPDYSHALWDDGFCIVPLEGAVDDVWTEKKYTAALEWDYSEQRARYVIDYLREVLERTDEAEVWHIWMGFGERAIVRTRHLTVDTIAPADLQWLDTRSVWETADGIPVQYCLVVSARKKSGDMTGE